MYFFFISKMPSLKCNGCDITVAVVPETAGCCSIRGKSDFAIS